MCHTGVDATVMKEQQTENSADFSFYEMILTVMHNNVDETHEYHMEHVKPDTNTDVLWIFFFT